MSKLRAEQMCLPCYEGEHGNCRKYPAGPRFAMGDKSQPCLCQRGGHVYGKGTCSHYKTGEWGEGYRCGKPAKDTVTLPSRFGTGLRDSRQMGEVERCGVHLAALRRVAANERQARRGEAAGG